MTTTKRDQPVGVLEHSDAAAEWSTSEPRLPVFGVRKITETDDGPVEEVVMYDMPAKPNPGLALKFLKLARQQGDTASSWLIETAIGSDGYDALADELINADDPIALLRAISEKIQTVAMGGLDGGPKA